MREITIPTNIGRDQRDILIRRAAREIARALQKIERMKAERDQQRDAEEQPAC